MTDELDTLADANAEPEEANDARTILLKGQRFQIDGHTFTLAMNAVAEGKKTDMLAVGLKPE